MRSSSSSLTPFFDRTRRVRYLAAAWFVICFLLTLAANAWYAMPDEHLRFDMTRVASLQPILRSAAIPVTQADSPTRRQGLAFGTQSQDFTDATRYLQQRVEERRDHRARHALSDWVSVFALALFAGLSLPLVLLLSAWASPRHQRP